MSKKKLKPLIITGGIIILAVIAILVVLAIPKETAPEVEELVVTLIDEDTDESDRVKITPRDSDYYEIVVTHPLDGSDATVDIVPEQAHFTYDTSSIKSYLSILSGLDSTSKVANEATEDDLKTWGLADPLATIEASWTNGDTVTVYIGNETALLDGYYCMIEGDSNVYLIADNFGKTLSKNEWNMRDMSYVAYDSSEQYSYDIIDELVVSKGDEVVYDCTLRSDEYVAENPGASNYGIAIPAVYETNNDNMDSYILLPYLNAMTFDDIVVPKGADPSKYGINTDTCYKAVMTDLEGNVYTTYFSDQQTESNGTDTFYYVYRPDTGTIYETDSSLSFLFVDPTKTISNVIWLHNVNTVDTVDFTLSDGIQHELRMEYGTDEDGETTITNAYYDDQAIGEVQAKRLYMRILGIYIVDSLDDDATWGDAEYTYTINMKDGTSSTLELCPINSRQYAMVLDGDATFYCGITEIKYMLIAMDYLEAGEEIPAE